jgi:site-specific DNA-methyltransferase (adenine-specific)
MPKLLRGDCLQVLKTLEAESVDSVVTDPPYGLSFMGKKWDYDVPSVEIWQQCLRVLKPGGRLLAFAGTRTQHRMCVNIEDAGFEIRDMIAWVYGEGFPKGKSCLKPALEPITMARKPANLIHDGSDQVTKLFPDTKSGNVKAYQRANRSGWAGPTSEQSTFEREGDSGSAARFFYCAKASKKDREEGNTHPTVKPTDLMAYLCRLVTPKGGTVLDPFMGSGSTGKAAMQEGFKFVGIERDAKYFDIAKKRLSCNQLFLT